MADYIDLRRLATAKDSLGNDSKAAIGKALTHLEDAADTLGNDVLALDGSRGRCYRLAAHYDDFAARMEREYPSLAGPAAHLGDLFRELDAALARLASRTEQTLVASDQVAAQVRDAKIVPS